MWPGFKLVSIVDLFSFNVAVRLLFASSLPSRFCLTSGLGERVLVVIPSFPGGIPRGALWWACGPRSLYSREVEDISLQFGVYCQTRPITWKDCLAQRLVHCGLRSTEVSSHARQRARRYCWKEVLGLQLLDTWHQLWCPSRLPVSSNNRNSALWHCLPFQCYTSGSAIKKSRWNE